MAIGAITLAEAGGGSHTKALFTERVSFAGDASYPTGGTAAFKASLEAKLKKGINIISISKAGACGGYEPVYDHANDKLMMFQGGGAAPASQVANTTNLSGTTFELVVVYH